MAITLDGSNGITTDIASNESATFNRDTTDGDIIILQKDNATVGSMGSISTALYVASPSGSDSGLRFDGAAINPCTTAGAYRDNAIDLGSTSAGFKDLYLDGGVYLGGIAATNKLDDYEEGEWTATFAGSATTATGKYVKTGALVHIQVFATLNVTSSVTAIISGLPFPVITYSVGTAAHNNYTSNADQGYFTSGGSSFTFMTNSSVNVASTVTGNPKYTMVAGTYYTTS